MTSAGLLRFPGNVPTLVNDGLDVIKSLHAPIVPVILIGDGRAGKSFLASRIADVPDLFVSQATAQAVTEGIDVAAIPLPQGGHLLLMDAEGGNNALAEAHSMVNVLALNLATSVVFVSGGRLSDDALQTLAQTLAVQALIQVDDAAPLPQRTLIFVVNMCNLQYGDNSLEDALAAGQQDPARREARQQIANAFPVGHRRFLSVPMEGLGGVFGAQVQALKVAVRGSEQMQLGGNSLNGSELAEIVIRSFQGIQNANLVQMPSVTRAIIFDGFLQPAAARLFQQYQDALPPLADYDSQLSGRDPRVRILSSFDTECAHIAFPEMKAEAKAWLSGRMDESWNGLASRNAALGQQAQETTTENQELWESSHAEEVGRGERRYGIAGPRKAIRVTRNVYRIETRSRSLLKHGEVIYGQWTVAGRKTV